MRFRNADCWASDGGLPQPTIAWSGWRSLPAKSRKEDSMQFHRALVPLALAAVVLPLAIACGGDDKDVPAPTVSSAQSQAKTQLCTELATLKTTATQVQSFNANTPVEDAKKAQVSLKASWEKVKAAARNVQDVKTDELERAQAQLDRAMDSIPPGATIASAAAQVQPQAQAVLQAQANVHTATACPSS
jgi:hypothetical protein